MLSEPHPTAQPCSQGWLPEDSLTVLPAEAWPALLLPLSQSSQGIWDLSHSYGINPPFCFHRTKLDSVAGNQEAWLTSCVTRCRCKLSQERSGHVPAPRGLGMGSGTWGAGHSLLVFVMGGRSLDSPPPRPHTVEKRQFQKENRLLLVGCGSGHSKWDPRALAALIQMHRMGALLGGHGLIHSLNK